MKTFLLLNCIFWTSLSNVQSQSATVTTPPYDAYLISADGYGHVWAFGNGAIHGSGLFHLSSKWEFVKYDNSHQVVAASSFNGRILIADDQGQMSDWHTTSQKWVNYEGISSVLDVNISQMNDNHRYAIGTVKQADGTYQQGVFLTDRHPNNYTSWKKVYTDAVAQSFVKIASDKKGNLYFVSDYGRIYIRHKDATEYTDKTMKGAFVKDVVVAENGDVYLTDKNEGVFKLDQQSGNWGAVNFKASSLGLDRSGNIYGVVNGDIKALKAGALSELTIANANQYDSNGNTPLTSAVLLNDQNAAQKASSNGAGVNIPNKKGDLPATLAAKNGNTNMMNFLISKGVDLDLKDADGHAALFYAVRSGDKNLAQAILIGKADPNTNDVVATAVQMRNKEMLLLLSTYKADMTPGLTKAIDMGDSDMFQTTLNYGAQLSNNEPFNHAVDKNNLDIATTCLERGADKEEALGYALKKGNKAVIDLCLKKGALPGQAVEHAIKQNDLNLVNSLMDTYNVSPDMVLEKSLPGSSEMKNKTFYEKKTISDMQRSQQYTASKINLSTAESALQKGAQASPFINYAAEKNNKVLLDLLLKYGGDPNILLKTAVMKDNMEHAQIAVDKGAQPILDDSLLKQAVQTDNTEMSLFLIKYGAGVTHSNLIKTAVEAGNIKISRALLKNGAPTSDRTLLPNAIEKNSDELVKVLLDYGADPNTGIQQAIEANKSSMAIMMLDKGAIATDKDLISTAATKGNMDVVSALLDKGAYPDNGMMAAIDGNKTAIFTHLLERGADATKTDYMVAAVSRGRAGMFNQLIDYGSSTKYTSSSNENLLHLSCKAGSYEITKILVTRGVDVKQKNNDGDTPLHFAADAGRNNVDLCSLLVDAGADVNAKNNRGRSILKVADGKKLKDYLKSIGAEK